MAAETKQIALDMEVFASDGEPLGRVGRIWYPDGRVEPPEQAQGTIELATTDRTVGRDSGFFQVARSLDIDWFVPFDQVAGVAGNRVTLKVTEADAQRQGWQQKPVRKGQ